MNRIHRILDPSPATIAGAYLLFGILWILLTDTLVTSIAESAAQVATLQILKGWVFVLSSAALVLVLTSSREHQIEAERSFTDLALDSLDDVFIVLGNDRDVQRVNERAVDVMGYAESE